MNIRDLQLGFSGLGHVRKEGLEIGVFLLRLRQAGSASFCVPGIRQCQFCAGNVFRIRVRVDKRLHVETGNVEMIVLHRVHAAVEEHNVRLLGINLRQRISDLLVGASGRERQRGSQNHDGDSQGHEDLKKQLLVVSCQ